MTSYSYADSVPAIREATPKTPWRCPWCGEMTWFTSDGDDRHDSGRVEMYCDNQDCDARETVVLITRGHSHTSTLSADMRADVRALAQLEPPPPPSASAQW